MKAMILAAGLGTRLRPLTDKMPKALVEVEGEPMLSRVIKKLKIRGFDRFVVNVHHFPDMIRDYLGDHDFGVKIEISDESENLLDTGGGIVKALPLLFKDNDEPVLIHNVDILSNSEPETLLEKVKEGEADVVLLVSNRDSSRKLIFDSGMVLKGWHDLKTDTYRPEGFVPKKGDKELAFSGIYVISKAAAEEMKKLHGEGKYSIMDYLLNPKREKRVEGVRQEDLALIDIGKPATLSQAHLFI